ncbi:hypothetical protein ACLQ9F_05795 [Bordetella avium]|uniref:hypothetical protein n=1 Tax=Bordetella avium TaxID=521 RepID=UPI000E695F68|nr:hypothetical protein [Bordetella avium]RIQ19824.1 hypothetical protein D0850_01180 [Bordetella avium]RIQ34404.1 hypothetical protein D0849_07160 [Bordetella avium]
MPAALLVIDVQEGLFRTDAPPADAPQVIRRINAMAARTRAARGPAAFICALPAETVSFEMDAGV